MGFFDNFLGTKAQDVQASLTSLLVQFDPQTASEAQIKTVADALASTNARLAALQANVQDARKAVDEDNEAIHQRMDAAAILSGQGKDDKAAVLLDEIDHEFNPKLESDRRELSDIQETIKATEARRTELEEKLRTARSRTDNARRELERAKMDQASAKEREAQAKRDAGVDRSVDRLDVASDAMERAAHKAREEANASRMQAESLGRVAPASKSGDADIAAALAEASGKPASTPMSVADRLKAMRAKAGDKAA